MKILAQLILIYFLLCSCSRDEAEIDPDNYLIGTWSYSGYEDNSNIFSRSGEFTDNHCYRFNEDGSLVERKNSGWCGTPPVSYADYEGTWTMLNDTVVELNVGFWGGQTTYRLDVEKVDKNILEVKHIEAD